MISGDLAGDREKEGRDKTVEVKSQDTSVAGFGHEGSSYQGMQVASKRLKKKKRLGSSDHRFTLDFGFQNCKDKLMLSLSCSKDPSCNIQHKTQLCSSRDWGTNPSAQEAGDAISQGRSQDLKVKVAKIVQEPGCLQI